MQQLSYHLQTKQPLRFRPDGGFRVLMLSDIQETLDFDPKTLQAMGDLMDRVSPDLVVLGGDNCNGMVLKSKAELVPFLDILASPMERRQIPWMHVFGNHDHDVEVDGLEETLLYEAFPHCVSKHTEGITGTTNYVLPVYTADGAEVALNLWALDTNNRIEDCGLADPGVHNTLKRPPVLQSSHYDILHFDQLMWYWNTSLQLEQHHGKKIPGILFQHIAPWEFQYVMDNPEHTGRTGTHGEALDLGVFNSGEFAALLQRGEIRCIACGHTHEDSFEGDFCGVKMCLDGAAGYRCYGLPDLRGGRVFEWQQSDPSKVHTYMALY